MGTVPYGHQTKITAMASKTIEKIDIEIDFTLAPGENAQIQVFGENNVIKKMLRMQMYIKLSSLTLTGNRVLMQCYNDGLEVLSIGNDHSVNSDIKYTKAELIDFDLYTSLKPSTQEIFNEQIKDIKLDADETSSFYFKIFNQTNETIDFSTITAYLLCQLESEVVK